MSICMTFSLDSNKNYLKKKVDLWQMSDCEKNLVVA